MSKYPEVKDKKLVGTYPGFVKSGGGLVWDDVLEYRVWCHPLAGATDLEDDGDYYYAFDNFDDAIKFSEENPGTEKPLALILQEEHINEPEPGVYEHVKEPRLAEWYVEWLSRPKRTANTIPDFLSPDAPPNRLEILRGFA
ncbi:MAG: GCN5 family acetyltransferase [Bacteroidetes bacterium]|nr:GCN5 family acetyltransferase [Bacteroidota bacterium]